MTKGRPGSIPISQPDDASEREADDVAERVMRMAEPGLTMSAGGIQRQGAGYEEDEENVIQLQPSQTTAATLDPHLAARVGSSGGAPLPGEVRSYFEPLFGRDFSKVRLHTDHEAAHGASAVRARAYTLGQHIVFGAGEFTTATTDGRRLIAHELAHVVQQERASVSDATGLQSHHGSLIQRDTDTSATQTASQATQSATPDPFTAPLTDSEWQGIDIWLSRGEVGIDPLTGDADHNADLIAAAIFCERALYHLVTGTGEDPLLCVLNDVTIADPRVQALKQEVISRGPIINWVAVPVASRMVHVMELLIDTHHYPVNAAAGIVGNLRAESGVLPSRIEGSGADTPMRSRNFAGVMTDFSPDEVMNRSQANQVGPRMPGIGLAQWTTAGRRSGLFQRTSQGRALGSSILFNMDAQVEYLVSELQANVGLNTSLRNAGVTLNDASDNVVYQFEIPGAILDAAGQRLPRADPAVQEVFGRRRNLSQSALDAYRAVHPENP